MTGNPGTRTEGPNEIPENVQHLITQLNDQDLMARAPGAVISAPWDATYAPAVPFLIPLIGSSEHAGSFREGGTITVAMRVKDALIRIGTPSVLPLVKMIVDLEKAKVLSPKPSKVSPRIAQAALHRITTSITNAKEVFRKIDGAEDILLDCLNSGDSQLRQTAARAVGILRVSSHNALALLIEALADEDISIRDIAYSTLKEITGKRFVFGGRSPEKWRKWLASHNKSFQ